MVAEYTSWNPARLKVEFRRHRFSLLGLVLLAIILLGQLASIVVLVHALVTRRRCRGAEAAFVPLLAAAFAVWWLVWSRREKVARLPHHERGRGGDSAGSAASPDGGHGNKDGSSFLARHGPISASAVIEHVTLPEKAVPGWSLSRAQTATSATATTATTVTTATTNTGSSDCDRPPRTPPGRANTAASNASTASGRPSKYAASMMQYAPNGLARTMSSRQGTWPAEALSPQQK